MEPGVLFIVRLHPLPSTNVLMVVSSLMSLLTQGQTTVRGQHTVRYCSILSVLMNIILNTYLISIYNNQHNVIQYNILNYNVT